MDFGNIDKLYMEMALEQACLAADVGEVPIGAVLVGADHEVLAASHNNTIHLCDPTAHAEIVVLRKAAKKLGNYRLLNSTLYVTLEPCAMCAGALIWARTAKVVFAAFDQKSGALGSRLCLHQQAGFNHRPEVGSGLMADESVRLLQKFFSVRRQK